MTLAAGVPDWVVELYGIAGEIQDGLASTGELRSVHVRPSLGAVPSDLVVTVGWHTHPPADTAYLVAVMVAGMWPVWLAEWGVGLEVAGTDWRYRADCGLMVELAESELSRPAWLLRATHG